MQWWALCDFHQEQLPTFMFTTQARVCPFLHSSWTCTLIDWRDLAIPLSSRTSTPKHGYKPSLLRNSRGVV